MHATTAQTQKNSFIGECLSLLRLAIPILVAQFCTQALSLVDSLCAAQAGELELAAVSLGCAFWSTVILLCLGIPFALAPVTAQLKGAGADKRIAGTIYNAWIPLSFITAIVIILMCTVPQYLLKLVGSEEALCTEAQRYLWWTAPAIPAIVIFQTVKNTIEGLTITKPGMYIAVGMIILNIPLNFIFINGKLGLPALGAAGCGAATSVVSWCAALSILLWNRRDRRITDLGLFKLQEKINPGTIRLLCRLGFPISFAYIIETFSYSAIGYVAASFGSRMVAAHQIANIICIMVFMLPVSMSSAVAIRTGYALGMRSLKAVKKTALAGLAVSLVLILTSATIIFCSRHEIIACFTSIPETVAATTPLFIFILFYQLQDAFYGTGLGILRGFRDNTMLLTINFMVLWLVVLPAGIFLAFYGFNGHSYGIYGLWCALVGGYYLISLCFGARTIVLFRHIERYFGPLDAKK